MSNCLYCKTEYSVTGVCSGCTIPVKTPEDLRFRVERNIRNYELQLPHATQENRVFLESEISKLKARLQGIL